MIGKSFRFGCRHARRLIAAAAPPRCASHAAALAAVCAGCAAPPDVPAGPQPARILSEDLRRARIALIDRQGPVAFGLPDGTQSSVLVTLPPEPATAESRALAMPTVYDVLLDGRGCYLDRRDTPEVIRLDGVTCLPTSGPDLATRRGRRR